MRARFNTILFSTMLLSTLVTACGEEVLTSLPTVAPSAWAVGDRVGIIAVDHNLKTVDDLKLSSCQFTTQFGEASNAGDLALVDQCVRLTKGQAPDVLQPGFAPVCAGDLKVTVGALSENVSICGDSIAPPASRNCDTFNGAIKVESFDPIDGDTVVGFTGMVGEAEAPNIMSPEVFGEGIGSWGRVMGDLLIGWGGFGASGIEIILQEVDDDSSAVHCYVEDSGSFSVPESVTVQFRGKKTAISVRRSELTEVEAGDTKVRITSRKTDVVWLQ